MRIRRFLISFCVALAFGVAWYFTARAAYERGVERGAHGVVTLIGMVSDVASALAGESPAARPSLPPVAAGYDWSTVAVVCGFIALFALYFSLHQLATLYDERA